MKIRNKATKKIHDITTDDWKKLKDSTKSLYLVVDYGDVGQKVTNEAPKEKFQKPESGEKEGKGKKRKGNK